MNPSNRLRLLFPDWQGCGNSVAVYHGALRLGDELWRGRDFAKIDVPAQETLAREDGILGLAANLRLLKRASALIRAHDPAEIFLIAGTCAAEIGPVSYLNRRYEGNLAVLWFDAHGDLNTPRSSPSGHLHGMPLRALLGDGHPQILDQAFSVLDPRQVVLVGGRDFDPPEADFVEHNSITVLPPAQLATPDILLSELAARGFDNVYLHLDLDVLDPDCFPHVLMPTLGGIDVATLTNLLRGVSATVHVAGFSVVEFAPAGSAGIERVRGFVDAAWNEGRGPR